MNRKKLQHKLNKIIRQINKGIINDDLWNGRFTLRQLSSQYTRYEDNSGGYLFVIIRMLDRKTGYYKDFVTDFYSFDELALGKLSWNKVNPFIVEDCDVWKLEKPYEEKARYTNEYEDRFNFTHWGYNWHLSRQYFNEDEFRKT